MKKVILLQLNLRLSSSTNSNLKYSLFGEQLKANVFPK